MSAHEANKGDEVTWKTSNGETQGKVEGIVTKPIRIKNNEVKATEANPKIIVKSKKTGALAAHKPDALKKS